METQVVVTTRGDGAATSGALADFRPGAQQGQFERMAWEARLRAWRQERGNWAEAARLWLEAKEAKSGSTNTRRAYEGALRMFFEHTQKEPWAVGGADVIGWQQAMRERELAETTINLRLAAVSSYYTYCHAKFTISSPFGGDEALAVFNPVARAERAKVDQYRNAHHLTTEQVRALLKAIPRDSTRNLRDFALIVTYLYTCRRSSEIRSLQWGDISHDKGRVYYCWGKEHDVGKGKSRTDELPLPAWNAIQEYLQVADRLDGPGQIQDEDYIFTALSDVATRLPHIDQVAENRPLTSAMVNRIVKKWARRAGLKWRLVKTHTLRHTGAMLRREFTDDPEKIQQVLAHSNISTTMIYLKKQARQADDLWAQVETLIGLDGEAG